MNGWNHVYPWQQSVWSDLIKRHHVHGLPHALMFTGPKGVGKHALSLQVAQWLLCSRRVSDNLEVACGQCHSCQLWAAGNHPDFQQCKPEDGSRQIRIDGVRKVNEFLVQTPQISPCQVVILAPVEVLNNNAANALLKTLEEPPGESFILLETERLGSVMPTIRSRCQRLTLVAPPTADSIQWLQQQGCDEHSAAQALRMNQNAPLAALEWMQNDAHGQHRKWLAALQQWSTGQAPLDGTLAVWKTDDLGDVLEWLSQLLSDLMRASMGATVEQLIEPEVLGCFDVAILDKAKLLALHERIAVALGQIRSGASFHNRQLLLESLMIEWQSLVTIAGRS